MKKAIAFLIAILMVFALSACSENLETTPFASKNESNYANEHDIVFIGYPIWWGEAPRIINTFLEAYDFSEKTIVPFCTSGSSGIGSSATNLHSLTPDTNWLTGRRFSGNTSSNTVMEWVDGLGLNLNDTNK